MYNVLCYFLGYFHFVNISGNPLIFCDMDTGDLGKVEAGEMTWNQPVKTFGCLS